MKKILESKIFLIIITAIVCISITSYAETKISASEVTYSSNLTVKDKIDTLYNKQIEKIDKIEEENEALSSQVSLLQQQFNSLTTAATSFHFISSTSTQTFNLGFQPNYISCFANLNNSEYETVIYNYDYDSSHAYKLNTTTSGNSMLYANAVRNLSTFFTINDNGFEWNITSWNGSIVYCTASK